MRKEGVDHETDVIQGAVTVKKEAGPQEIKTETGEGTGALPQEIENMTEAQDEILGKEKGADLQEINEKKLQKLKKMKKMKKREVDLLKILRKMLKKSNRFPLPQKKGKSLQSQKRLSFLKLTQKPSGSKD